MSAERQFQTSPRRPYEVFGLSDQEQLKWRVSQERFDEIINDKQTMIHSIRESSNNYGEFLFVTTSRPGEQSRICMTFYGLGYHEYRERWVTGEWFWYQSNLFPDQLQQQLTREEAEELIKQRREDISLYVKKDTQTERGRVFEMLADLTDEDSAYAEMQDLDDLSDWLDSDY